MEAVKRIGFSKSTFYLKINISEKHLKLEKSSLSLSFFKTYLKTYLKKERGSEFK